MKAEVFDMIRLLEDRVNDEINLLTRHPLDAFLDDMVTVLVINAINNSIFEFLHEQLFLLQ